ncbi:ogr/Delta-like zinc finger family protein [Escherichia coli]|uniref:ogr/Delta-like zinc finger family protein n=1 Tax=Escherichia coli TaxID=562 RepID=UPI003CC90BA8
MFHCPLCQHAAHARTSRYITDTTKERYHQCQNVNCSATGARDVSLSFMPACRTCAYKPLYH